MNGSSEDAAEDYPQICRRAEFGSHYGAENRSRSGNIEELDHKDFPGWHRDIVQAVSFGICRGDAIWIRPEYTVNEFSIEKVAQNEGCYT